MKRKRIGVITAYPEAIYQQRVMNGLFRRCRQYDYDIAVFAPLVHVAHEDKDYLHAELNIFELINFDLLDGILVLTIPLEEGPDRTICRNVLELLRKKCDKPIVTMDIPIGEYHCIATDDIPAFDKIVEHLADVHQCRNIYFLNGNWKYHVSEKRLEGIRNAFARRNLPLPEEHIFHGDFWYTSGEVLAERIISHELAMPDAVICANDHMAIGLIGRLQEHGISVPEQIRVTGFDASAEAAINEPAVTSCVPEVENAAAKAVDYLRSEMEPDAELLPLPFEGMARLTLCASCGCHENISYIKQRLDSLLLHVNINYNAKNRAHPDFYMLLEGYVPENLTSAENPDDCLNKILHLESLIRPYAHFWLCLRENWLDTDFVQKDGYPERMKTVIHADLLHPENSYCDSGVEAFSTAEMLLQLLEEREEPAVFYFTPVHFQEDTFGYAVLESLLSEERQIDHVYHTWIRYVNTALEMVRAKHKLTAYSECDAMTGLMNRRGLEHWLSQQEKRLSAIHQPQALLFIVDMDGLKHINDCYGHKEGDFAIKSIARAVETMAKSEDEICVRLGGDEFLMITICDDPEQERKQHIRHFSQYLQELNRISMKAYRISASIGSASAPFTGKQSISALIEQADRQMYQRKVNRKKNRI